MQESGDYPSGTEFNPDAPWNQDNPAPELMDYRDIDNVELDGLDMKDYPDFSDAFILSADYCGTEMTEAQLEEINEDSDFVYEQVLKSIS